MVIGICLVVIGIVLRLKCINTLKDSFTFTLEYPTKIVTTGLYKCIRHPSYFGSLIMILGWSLIHPILGIMQISYSFFLSRMVEEEKKLSIYEEYNEYKKTTGILLPKFRR